ncbi:hypothetical protein [Maricaulis sp.]|uniref:hypothetical protein n=1 Tax=Maricaulis sp. TaxID=1486257 RepID=UPI003A944770
MLCTGVVLALSALLLLWVGVSAAMLAGSLLVQAVWTFGAAQLLVPVRRYIPDPVQFHVLAYAAGLALTGIGGLAFMHRALLGETPVLAALATMTPLAGLAIWRLARWHKAVTGFEPIRWPRVAALLAASCIVAAMTAYGFANNDENIRINSTEWLERSDIVPEWAYQSDRLAHYTRNTQTLFEEGLPPRRVNHRAFHSVIMVTTVLTGPMSAAAAFSAAKILAIFVYFTLSYSLFGIAGRVFGMGVRTATLIGASTLIFSPLKLPLFALTPTYRGFLSASGTMYHSDTQLFSMAVAAAGLFATLIAFREKRSTLTLGALLIGASFFFKPPSYMALAPAILGAILFQYREFDRDRLLGAISVLAIPWIWFTYLSLTAGSSPMDNLVPVAGTDAATSNLTLQFHPFQGYQRWLTDRFPDWVYAIPGGQYAGMVGLSCAAFWVAWARAAEHPLIAIRSGAPALRDHLAANAHIYLMVGAFVFAILIAIMLAGPPGSMDINWKWPAAASFVLCLPVFAAAIAAIPNTVVRHVSWGLYAAQCLQGLGYLAYFFWTSRLS